MHVSPEDVHHSIVTHPKRRIAAELYCLVLAVWFHSENNHTRKFATIAIVVVWASMEVGAAYGLAHLPEQFFFLRVVVGVLIGRMWGIEINNFAGVEFDYSEGDDGDD